jgi:hypothetical protein
MISPALTPALPMDRNVGQASRLPRPRSGHADARSSARLCENSSRKEFFNKSTLTFSFWRMFIFDEGDLNHFFVFQNDQI